MFYKTRGRTNFQYEQLETVVMDIEWHLNNCLLMCTYVENKLGEEQVLMLWERQHVCQQWKREYFHGLMESHHIRTGAQNYWEGEEVVLIVREEKNRGEWKKGLFLRGVFLWHKDHTIERPLNLVCSLETKGPAVVGTAPVAKGLELRRNTWSTAQDARVRLQLLSQDEDCGVMPTISVMLSSLLLNCCIDVQTERLIHSFHRTLQMKIWRRVIFSKIKLL